MDNYGSIEITVNFSKPVEYLSSQEFVKSVRGKTDLTQERFSKTYGVPLRTLRSWEQGQRNPDKFALSYLKVIDADPEYVAKLVIESSHICISDRLDD